MKLYDYVLNIVYKKEKLSESDFDEYSKFMINRIMSFTGNVQNVILANVFNVYNRTSNFVHYLIFHNNIKVSKNIKYIKNEFKDMENKEIISYINNNKVIDSEDKIKNQLKFLES